MVKFGDAVLGGICCEKAEEYKSSSRHYLRGGFLWGVNPAKGVPIFLMIGM